MKSNVVGRSGQAGLILLFVVIAGLVGVYFGNQYFSQKNYIRLFDGEAIRYLDIPPYAQRLTSADQELIGVCDISIGTSPDQATNFLKTTCNSYGYLCTAGEESVQIEIRRNYLLKGIYEGNKLKLRWTPVLPEKLKSAAEALSKKTE
ncbi:MAG: hypothetical protein KKB51_16055 [Candidatus Riflebacteria bacterium]|nr:hypothetical protein [Candidatus Riflebacteria bacterium]